MIDPLEAVIRLLSSDAELSAIVGDRVAAKHRYGEAWTVGEAALVVRLDGGTPMWYVPTQAIRIETRCYASSQAEAMSIWRRLVGLSREVDRAVVDVSDGAALIYHWLPESGPSTLFDEEVGMDMVMCFWSAAIAEGDVSGQ